MGCGYTGRLQEINMISAIVLAAGQSRRMGSPKINLPWGMKTVLGQVVGTLLEAGLDEIILVTGAHTVVGVDEFVKQGVKLAYNPDYTSGEMLSSFQVGIQFTALESQATLLALGDQPQMELAVVRAVVQVYTARRPRILIPSYQMRRGHPGVVSRELWGEILSMTPPATLREFLNAHANEIAYLNVTTETVIQDLDTPEDYERFRPR
jgi:molybdenum cofactor cytidylyltransferase